MSPRVPASTTTAPLRFRASEAKWTALTTCGEIALAAALARAGLVDPSFPWRTFVLIAAGAALVLWSCARYWPGPAFGAANAVTLVRGALTMLLFAVLGAGPGAAWVAVVIALVALLLDGLDGRLARSRGETSAFGARFDMETDALVILALAVLAWQFGKAGHWIVLSGALRYAFVLAALAVPWLAQPLPRSRRRQTVCVVQIATLIACVSPLFVPPWSAAIGLIGLAALLGSFALDIAWLAQRTGSVHP
jgi:phosphatidylglycerophosphate synthase